MFIRGGLGRLHSMRGRYRSERGSESSAGALQHQASIERQTSIQRQTSVQQQTSIQRQTSVQRQASKLDTKMLEKRQEEWDKEIPSVPLTRVLAVNAKEWWMILLGVIGAALSGCLFPAFAIIFGEIFAVFALPADQIQDQINLYAGLMALLGAAAAVGIFLKVRCQEPIKLPSLHLHLILSRLTTSQVEIKQCTIFKYVLAHPSIYRSQTMEVWIVKPLSAVGKATVFHLGCKIINTPKVERVIYMLSTAQLV